MAQKSKKDIKELYERAKDEEALEEILRVWRCMRLAWRVFKWIFLFILVILYDVNRMNSFVVSTCVAIKEYLRKLVL